MEPGLIFQIAAMIAAAAVGAIAGAIRGVAMVERRAEAELERVNTAQAQRIALLEQHREELEAKVRVLEGKVKALEQELEAEKRITARIARPRAPRQASS